MSQKQRAVGSKTKMIKAKMYNQVARFFHPKDEKYIGKNLNQAFADLSRYKATTPEEEKLLEHAFKMYEKLSEIQKITRETYSELRDYKNKRKAKAKRDKLREERGYKPKKKTSLKEWEAMQNQKQAV